MSRRILRTALALALAVLTPRTAHAHSAFTGRWDIAFGGGMRMENDEATPVMVKRLLTITGTTDSLIATRKVTSSEVTAISTWSLSVNGDALSGTVSRELEGMMAMGGMPASPVTGTRTL